MKGAHIFKIIKVIFFLILFSHVVACAYCLLASLEASSPTWIDLAVRPRCIVSMLASPNVQLLPPLPSPSPSRAHRISFVAHCRPPPPAPRRSFCARTRQNESPLDSQQYVEAGNILQMYSNAFYQARSAPGEASLRRILPCARKRGLTAAELMTTRCTPVFTTQAWTMVTGNGAWCFTGAQPSHPAYSYLLRHMVTDGVVLQHQKSSYTPPPPAQQLTDAIHTPRSAPPTVEERFFVSTVMMLGGPCSYKLLLLLRSPRRQAADSDEQRSDGALLSVFPSLLSSSLFSQVGLFR